MNGVTGEDEGLPLKDWALKAATAGGVIGVLLGLVQLIIGKAMIANPWIDENGLMFGLITIVLSLSTVYFAYGASKETSTDLDRKLGWLVGLFIPSVLCFFLIGILWMLPMILLFGSALLYLKVMLHDLKKDGIDLADRIPKWKRRIVIISALFILVPVLFGNFVPNMEIGSVTDGNDVFRIRPMDRVAHLENGETVSSSDLTGVLIVHIILLLGGLITLIFGQLGARTITLSTGVIVAISLLFIFLLLPNIFFIEGAKFEQFTSDHFSAISGGWYIALGGTLTLIISQFIGQKGHGSSANGK